MESRRPPAVPIHIVPQCLDRRTHDAPRRLMLVRVICHHAQPITCPPKRSSPFKQPVAMVLQHVHDGIVGRVEQNHDAGARYGMGHLQDHVCLGAGGTPEYGVGAAAGSEMVGHRLHEMAAVEHTKYRTVNMSSRCRTVTQHTRRGRGVALNSRPSHHVRRIGTHGLASSRQRRSTDGWDSDARASEQGHHHQGSYHKHRTRVESKHDKSRQKHCEYNNQISRLYTGLQAAIYQHSPNHALGTRRTRHIQPATQALPNPHPPSQRRRKCRAAPSQGPVFSPNPKAQERR